MVVSQGRDVSHKKAVALRAKATLSLRRAPAAAFPASHLMGREHSEAMEWSSRSSLVQGEAPDGA